jgi:hypothetical protein
MEDKPNLTAGLAYTNQNSNRWQAGDPGDVEEQLYGGPGVGAAHGPEEEVIATFRVSENAYGILVAAGLDYHKGGAFCRSRCVSMTGRAINDEHEEDFSPYFLPGLLAAIISALVQGALMYWVYTVSFENEPTDPKDGEACNVPVLLKLISIGIHVVAVCSNFTSVNNHDAILSRYKSDCPTIIKWVIGFFANFSEFLQNILYLPVGFHYIMVQKTME